MVLSLRTMCAEPPHNGKEWKEKLIMVYPYIEKRGILMRNGFLIILMKNVSLMHYANRLFHFIPLPCHNKESF